MEKTDNYQLVNAINKERKLAAIRSEILAMPAEKALDVILDSSFPATLVQSFPDQDLYFLMHHIGEEDFLPVLALASSQQWEYILDVEVWHSDRLDIAKMTNTLSLLYKADPERLIRWAVKEKTEFIEYYLFRNMEIRIREHDEDPSDFADDFSTIDSVFYFRFPEVTEMIETDEPDSLMIPEARDTTEGSDNGDSDNKDADDEDSENIVYDDTQIIGPETTETLITNMLNTLADLDMSVLHGVLLETGSVIPAEIEEEEFRLKNVRLAEKGFLPPHEAVAVYQPLKIKDLRRRPAIFLKNSVLDSDIPLPPSYPLLMLDKQRTMQKHSMRSVKSLFASALENLDKNEDIALNIQSEFAFLVNSVVSADKKTLRSREELEKTVGKTCCYLSLGIEIIHSELTVNSILNSSGKLDIQTQKDSALTPALGALILRNYALKDIFRCGSGAGIVLKEKARHWYDESYIVKLGLPLTFLGEKWLGVVGGLLLDRPLFFDNYTTDTHEGNNYTDSTYTTGTLYKAFASIEEIKQASNELDAIIEIDKMVKRVNPDAAFLSHKFLTWKSLLLTLWAIKRMGIESLCTGYCIPLNRFKLFFIQLLNLKSRKQAAICDKPETCGKIVRVVRNDFLNWLCESGYVQENDKEGIVKKTFESEISSGNAVSTTISRIFDEVFDEIEGEYGSVSSEDIDQRLIYHFIIQE